MKLIKSIIGEHGRSLLRLTGVKNFSAAAAAGIPAEQYDRRNYANNLAEYNTVFSSLSSQRKWFLLRDAYNDMLLDGVQPSRESFHSLIIGTMRGARLQDAFYFKDQMKAMGLVPDVALYNFLISLCGKCGNSEPAIRLLEEMKNNNVKPNGQTFICLLNTCAASGRIDKVKGIVSEMGAAGLSLNKYCIAGQITAYKNKKPMTDETSAKIIELVEKSKGWSTVETSSTSAENRMMNISEEELYNIPTADFVNRRGGFFRSMTVYHVAVHACADLKDKQAMETILEMLKKEGKDPDVYIAMQAVRCYMNCGDFDAGVKAFEDYTSSKIPVIELYVTLIEGAMRGHTPRGMQLATETLEKMNARNFFLSSKMGSELLLAASGEKTGGYATANYIWDLMQARKVYVNLPAVEAYHKGLKDREIPADDPRLMLVARTLDNLRSERNQPRGE
ncbi:hypothetical protein MKW94_001949 [Papaver nudicaule]|uniref:Pentatricopeptide repeat-containing protein n=1 Tax=Papaver nudicaule TaxID=74823 RepID=A0AA41SBP1_PAPNU|nr:hypothetical protein [Papaver nudicaule]